MWPVRSSNKIQSEQHHFRKSQKNREILQMKGVAGFVAFENLFSSTRMRFPEKLSVVFSCILACLSTVIIRFLFNYMYFNFSWTNGFHSKFFAMNFNAFKRTNQEILSLDTQNWRVFFCILIFPEPLGKSWMIFFFKNYLS